MSRGMGHVSAATANGASAILTTSAERYASENEFLGKLRDATFDRACAVGDVISIEAGNRPHEFVVLRRRWIIGDGGPRLELTLDHPARRGS